MRTTVTLDEALLTRAQHLSGVEERSALLKEALNALIQRESARRLARLGGTEPQLENVARRREGVPEQPAHEPAHRAQREDREDEAGHRPAVPGRLLARAHARARAVLVSGVVLRRAQKFCPTPR